MAQAPDLGAPLTAEQNQRLRGYAAGDDRWGWQNVKHSDVAVLLELVDAQAARLAAVEQALDDLRTGTHEMLGELLEQHQIIPDPCPGGPCVANALIAIGNVLTATTQARATAELEIDDAG